MPSTSSRLFKLEVPQYLCANIEEPKYLFKVDGNSDHQFEEKIIKVVLGLSADQSSKVQNWIEAFNKVQNQSTKNEHIQKIFDGLLQILDN